MRLPALRNWRPTRYDGLCKRFFSQETPPHSNVASKSKTASSTSNVVTKNATQQDRFDRFLKRTPKFLHRHVSSLRSAPITHISAFLILHEITAVVPLFGLAGAFHYYEWLPAYFSEGAWVVSGVEKFGRYFKRKGWISGDEEQEAERLAEESEASEVEQKKKFKTGRWWDRGEGGVRIVVEFATAYAIVKALLIPRLIVSAWGAPWFARWTVVPITNGFKRTFGRGRSAIKSTGSQ